ncbi:innate immunity activator protein [Pteronotus mesoamericanus]|uniref:innate immunity activator protein n=1 Tax=Pteronotus mesoamericanus TaxID=1884717 RepID=UPI0023ECE13C|nr:innate immunity activator protein [Pteronotus parnellii mesoamericanus]
MLRMPKLTGIPPGRAGRGEAQGEGQRPGHARPAAAGPDRGARARARGAAAPGDSWGNAGRPARPGPGWGGCRASLPRPPARQPAMEGKDEASDTDSGVILQSGPDSPVSPLKELREVREVRELTHAMRKQQQALEERLGACLQELRALCLREAELTGVLPADYPLKPGEKAPKVRRRIGAAYKLDEQALRREDPLSSLERELALQLQIAEAARRLSREEKLSRQARRQRKHAVLREEEKLRALERCLGEQRRHRASLPAAAPPLGHELCASDDSSLSDALLPEEEEAPVPKPATESPPRSLEGLQPAGPETGGLDPAPIQNGPWKETSLDQPYEKPGKTSDPSSESSSPATVPHEWPAPCHVVPVRSVPGQRQGRTSAPTTPDMQGKRAQSQSLRMDSFRAGPRRRPTHYTVTVPSSCWPPRGAPRPPPAPRGCSEDSGSDGSSVSHATPPGGSSPDIYTLQPLSPPRAPGCHGAWGPDTPRPSLLPLPPPPGPFPAELYMLVTEGRLPPGERSRVTLEEERLALRLQQLQQLQQHVRPRGRPARAPSLKDSPTGRALCRAAVSQELQCWHERARLRSARPHSLDRQGAFRVRSLPLGRSLGPRTQVPAVCVLRRSPEGAPVQVFVPENGEIISQV